MTGITDSTNFDVQSVTMIKTHSTDAKFWPRAYASLVDNIILMSITFVFVFSTKLLLNEYEFSYFEFFNSTQLNAETLTQLNLAALIMISGLIFGFVIRFIYYCYYLSSIEQATPGMKLHGLKLVDSHGKPVSLGQIFLREIISIISFWGLFIGYLMILFTKRRQALHDIVTSTYVRNHLDDSNIEILISQNYQNYNFAGFWRRFWATILDNIICIGFAMLFMMILYKNLYNDSENLLTNIIIITNDPSHPIISTLLFSVLPIFYWVIFTASKFQATPGKMLFSLKIIDNDGHQLTVFKSFIRYFTYFYSIITLGIGFIMAAFTRHKQGLHDKIALTYVIHVPKKVKDKIIKSD